MYVALFGGSVVCFSAIVLEQLKLEVGNWIVFLWMITENGFGIMSFFLKGVLGDKKLLFCNMENIIDTTNRKENLFNPIEKAMKSKVPLF